MMLEHPELKRLLRKLEVRATLHGSERAALAALSFHRKVFEPGSCIVHEGLPVQESALILDGFAYRQKLNQDGGRQIVNFHMAGDLVGVEGALLRVSDHNVQALTRCEVAAVPTSEIVSLIDAHPRLARALWIDTLVDGSIYREWIMNVGRRTARQRLAHLLCEMAKRLKLAGLGDEHGYSLPMTQEQLADATGLTPVHVNRSLRTLEAEGLIVRRRRFIGIPDWERLRDESGFHDLYLHLDQVA